MSTGPLSSQHFAAMTAAMAADRVRLLYAGLPLAILSHFLIAAALIPVLAGHTTDHRAWLWGGLLMAALCYRALISLQERRTPLDEANSHIWLYRFRFGAMATGCVWGLASLLLFPDGDIEKQLLLCFALTGLMAGAMASLSVDDLSLYGFTVPMLVPLFYQLGTADNGVALSTLAAVLAFLAFMAVSARRFSVSEHNNIRLRHEMQWRESELRRYEFIANTVSDLMGVISHDRRYEAVNDSWCRMMGKARESVVGERVESVWQAPLEVTEALTRCFSAGTQESLQTTIDFPAIGGRECFIACYPYRQQSGEVTHVVIVTRDITDLARSRRELEEARDVAERASRAKSEFLASMSHELRTPLNAILGFSQLFVMDETLSEDTRNCAGEIERAGHHLLALVNDLIDLARIESGNMDLTLEPVEVKSVIDHSLALIAPIAKKQQIRLLSAFAGVEAVRIHVDAVRLNQTLINLLSNAVKYNMPSGTVTLAARVEHGRIRISVTDTGKGIDAAAQSRIFNAFDRLGAERGTVEGTGIGLVITRRIVEAMGGSIGFSSTVGRGSTFWVEFPVCADRDVAMIDALATTELPATEATLLYIEDNEVNRWVMRRLVASRTSLHLLEAASAEEGIALARNALPDLILMDINLPGMDGYQALSVLKNMPETRDIPVVAASANAMKGDGDKGLAAGFDAYITKPVDARKLLAVVAQTICR
ncbi:response regulator [Mariprofundus erugo]|nr:response regulator [Mariprofundus erugo]